MNSYEELFRRLGPEGLKKALEEMQKNPYAKQAGSRFTNILGRDIPKLSPEELAFRNKMMEGMAKDAGVYLKSNTLPQLPPLAGPLALGAAGLGAAGYFLNEASDQADTIKKEILDNPEKANELFSGMEKSLNTKTREDAADKLSRMKQMEQLNPNLKDQYAEQSNAFASEMMDKGFGPFPRSLKKQTSVAENDEPPTLDTADLPEIEEKEMAEAPKADVQEASEETPIDIEELKQVISGRKPASASDRTMMRDLANMMRGLEIASTGIAGLGSGQGPTKAVAQDVYKDIAKQVEEDLDRDAIKENLRLKAEEQKQNSEVRKQERSDLLGQRQFQSWANRLNTVGGPAATILRNRITQASNIFATFGLDRDVSSEQIEKLSPKDLNKFGRILISEGAIELNKLLSGTGAGAASTLEKLIPRNILMDTTKFKDYFTNKLNPAQQGDFIKNVLKVAARAKENSKKELKDIYNREFAGTSRFAQNPIIASDYEAIKQQYEKDYFQDILDKQQDSGASESEKIQNLYDNLSQDRKNTILSIAKKNNVSPMAVAKALYDQGKLK